MNYIGIDPGSTGGLAFLPGGSLSGAQVVSLQDLTAYDIRDQLCDWYTAGACVVIIEKQQAYPKQGIASTAKHMAHYGELRGLVIAFSRIYTIAFDVVTPKTWQTKMLVKAEGPDTKTRSRTAAQRLFSHLDFRRKTKDHGKSDALLIALWGKQYGGYES